MVVLMINFELAARERRLWNGNRVNQSYQRRAAAAGTGTVGGLLMRMSWV